MIIRAKAPNRVSFGGGGTDMAPYCVEHGGCVISTTIDRHVYVSIKQRNDKIIHINSLDFNKEMNFEVGDRNYDTDFELFKGVINVLDIREGFDIMTFSDLPSGSGMGGSSTLCVALIGAFNEFYSLKLSKHDIALKACEVERVELKQKGGYQDQFAAAYGGFNFIEFSDKVVVSPLNSSVEMINELQFRLVLCYVGGSHFSSNIQDEVLKGYEVEKKSYMDAMQDLKNVAYSMKDIIKSNDILKLREFGEYLHQGWIAKKSLSSKISNIEVEKFYLTSRKFGTIGGKLLGAGGGGHLLLFCNPEKKYDVIKEMEKIGGKVLNFHFNSNGLEVWKVIE